MTHKALKHRQEIYSPQWLISGMGNKFGSRVT